MAKKDKMYDALNEQIGHLGGEPMGEPIDNTLTGLGKLEHVAAYGGKPKLTPEEENAKNSFLKRQQAMSEEEDNRRDMTESTPITHGWIPLSREEFGVRGQFYPEEWEFFIRPATTQAIKNWIGIDEKNALQLNRTFDEIIKFCVKIKCGDTNITWSKINTWDRFWLILKVREATFASNKKAISFEDNCAECDNEITFELRSTALHYEFPDEDIVEKYWDAASMSWKIDVEEYGVDDHEPITLYTPTLAKQQAIIDWAQRLYNRNKKIDETFASTFLPWLIKQVPKDETAIDKMFQRIEKEYKSWSVPMHELMIMVVQDVTINPNETLKQTCPHCGEEVVSNVQFPNGVKVLFQTESKVQKFGSR